MSDLVKERSIERSNTSFPIKQLTNFLDDGETEKLQQIMLNYERDPIFQIKDHDLTWKQRRELTFLRITKLVPYLLSEDEDTFTKRLGLLSLIDGATLTEIGVHYGLFVQTIRSLGTSKQFQHWIVKRNSIQISKIYGCFAMTELTHGSNVAKLQTTATFQPDSDSFIINTPFLGATKWWIGGAAHTATHCVVYARLISRGKDYGVKNFIVQLRDLHTGSLLPGIAIGDIGKKMGRDGIDNGWIQFTNVKINRFNMLSKYTQIDPDGNVTLPKFEQLSYNALVIGRVSMVNDSYNVGKKFITIALRYATTRRQFGKDGDLEKKLIDYTHHRRRLFPLLATVFAFNSSGLEVTKFNKFTQSLIQKGDNESITKAILNVKDLFALSAGLKAFSTWEVCKIIEESRQSCGGHGYSAYNQFGPGYNDWVVQCTWEGDNNVLALSCGRALIQNYIAVTKGERIGNYSKYLTDESINDVVLRTSEDLNDISNLIKLWELVSKKLIQSTVVKFNKLIKVNNSDLDKTFEELSYNRFEIAKIHTKLICLKTFNERVDKSADGQIKPVLKLLVKLYALHITSENISQFYSFGIVNGNEINELINVEIDKVNEELRPDIIGLTDAFNLSDFFIGAPIGKYDGDVYDAYFKFVNNQVGHTKWKPDYYDTLYKPFLNRDLYPNDNEVDLEQDEEEEEE